MALALPTVARRETARPLDRWWRRAAPYVFISPFYLIFLAFGLLPIVFSLGVSLYDWRGTTPGAFVGLANYQVLLHDPAFYKALWNTVYRLARVRPADDPAGARLRRLAQLAAGPLPRLLPHGLLPAGRHLAGDHRSHLQLPLQSQLRAWRTACSSRLALRPINWLADPTWMKPVLILALLWRWTGNDMVIMLAGLQSIPGDLYEAARVDGASGPQMFWHITVPLMRPVILFDAIISTIGTFNLFAEPFVLFGQDGGIGQAGLVTGTLLYQNAFVYFKFGYGAALAWVLALIIFALSMMQLKLGSREAD